MTIEWWRLTLVFVVASACGKSLAEDEEASKLDAGGALVDGSSAASDGGTEGSTGGSDGSAGDSACTVACPQGTSCVSGGTCRVDIGTTCATAISLDHSVTLVNALCADAGTLDLGSCADAGIAPASEIALVGGTSWDVRVTTLGRDVVFRFVSPSSCTPSGGSCNLVKSGGGSVTDNGLSPGGKVAVGLTTTGSGCADYILQATKQ